MKLWELKHELKIPDRFMRWYPEWKCKVHPELMLLKRMDLREGGLECLPWVKECLEILLPFKWVSLAYLAMELPVYLEFHTHVIESVERYLKKRKRDE